MARWTPMTEAQQRLLRAGVAYAVASLAREGTALDADDLLAGNDEAEDAAAAALGSDDWGDDQDMARLIGQEIVSRALAVLGR